MIIGSIPAFTHLYCIYAFTHLHIHAFIYWLHVVADLGSNNRLFKIYTFKY